MNIYAIDCTIAKGTVSILVHWLILRRPVSPSFDNSSSDGIALVSNCTTIEPVMYGDKPTNIILNDANPPPDIKFKKFEKSDFSSKLFTASLKVDASPIGTGICASSLYATNIPSIINTRRSISLFLNDLNIVLNTLNEAIAKRKDVSGLILHSDQGFQYTSYEYKAICNSNNIQISMSRKGTPIDDSPMESFHGILKKETLYNNEISSIQEYKLLVEDWILFYNTYRIKSKSSRN